MSLKIVIGDTDGKSYQKELSKEEAEALYGKVLGEEINGELINLPSYKLLITGGSDYAGFPMRKDLSGIQRKKILISKSIGFSGKIKGKRFSGLRVKKTVAGNTIYEDTHQINLKVIKKGKESLAKLFGKEEIKEKKEGEN